MRNVRCMAALLSPVNITLAFLYWQPILGMRVINRRTILHGLNQAIFSA